MLAIAGQPQNVTTEGLAVKVCRSLEKKLLDSEMYLHAGTLLWGPEMFNSEPECVVRVFEALRTNAKVLFQGASSMGKSLAPDTKVLMYDGSIKRAEDVIVGDRLMGDDSQPRTVLTRNDGYGGMYRIIPERGEPWVCNYAHILTLRVSANKRCGSGHMSKKWVKGDVIDIEIEDYLKLSADKKNRLKQFSVAIEFPEQPLRFDAYIYGCWLGDGTRTAPTLNTPPGPMSKEWERYFKSLGYNVTSKSVGVCSRFYAGNNRKTEGSFIEFIKQTGESGEKRISPEYLINSRENRLKILAGLIDSDGWIQNKSGYQFVSKYKHLADQVSWLCRSLGFSGHQYAKVKKIKSIGFEAVYHHVSITGAGVTQIPTREKRCIEPTGKKNLLNTSFWVEKIEDGKYCSFSIDGNHRFLLQDFTVTHNSYNAGVWMYLDWRRDPLYTSVKCVGISEDQVRKHVFAHLAKLHRAATIPMLEDVVIRDSDMWMGVKDAGYEFGITAIAYKQSQETSGGLKGYKSMAVRQKPHPKFGYMSRLRFLGDEGQNWPNGPFKDLNTTMSQISGPEMVKIAIAYNPESTSQLIVKMAEPDGGWEIEDLDRLYDWDSSYGWRVCRLDAAKCENVIQKKNIYQGLQTWEGFVSYLKSGGDNSPNYATFARGFPPLKGSVNTIIPTGWPQSQRGEATFIDNPVTVGAVDLAFMGKDSAQMAVGRWGLASGWKDHRGNFTYFMDRLNAGRRKPRHLLQVDQILPMQKHDDTIKMAEEIMGRAKVLGISPEWMAVDRTSIGLGTYSHLAKYWGPVMGIAWNEKSTERKILMEDKEGANEQCDGVMSEMWWAFRRWLDPVCNAILINPIIPPQPINTQFTTRRYSSGKGKGIKVESKEVYKARNNNSPDEADSIIMLVHVVRKNSPVIPGLLEQQEPTKQEKSEVKWLPVAVPAFETEDTITPDGED